MSSRWTLARVLILILAGSFLGLMADIRVEHVDVVHKTGLAWIPIIYSAVMVVACVLGFYLHNPGKMANVLTSSANAWIDPQMKHLHGPPQTAPLAFVGLSLLGVVATLKCFNEMPSPAR
jgi:hypothetical protein